MKNKPWSGRGLYAITDRNLLPHDQLPRKVGEAIAGGACLVQYRDKGSDEDRRRQEVSMLIPLCHRHAVPLIINDDIDLAYETGADGVHLGIEDDSLERARARLGNDAIIGVSCYNRLDRAIRAAEAGADYVAFGRFFPSRTKPGAIQADIGLLQEARKRLSLPIAVIGGISPENALPLVEAGADLLAVIDGVFGQEDPRRAAGQFTRLFRETG